MTWSSKARYIFFVLLGAAALVLKRHYSGPSAELVTSYGGNVSVSFAVYFMFRISTQGWRYGKLAATGLALLAVEFFEVTNGFGVMSNVYDPADFVANALGIGLAWALDTLIWSMKKVNLAAAGDKKRPPKPLSKTH